ncbi:glycerol-3-phosphate dehydrogenase [Litorimonas taeanensis]|uniref:Glycerol-3-phosphate dehydrogenase n=1 Tax=Litorimonas taeanensis TaxID=568099 RepID=A0A420WDT7_9PROT|nr:glycerol-3-phosphate dehydrogenase [Litorimonas taeanensis]RKQ69189.1 glycerol-3-phosphate dehydrogenase [Litorimonas taeanensis]
MTAEKNANNQPQSYDMLVIGGGINGTAIARDAAGRGLSVLLCERDDLASHTSSASTKLIHGGLRYLEHYDFRLVRESLKEREVLLRAAPHIIWPMRFVLPYDEGLRPKWILRLGLFLYDNLGGRELLPGTKTRKLTDPIYDELETRFTTGYEYSDCWVEDSRLVTLYAMDAARCGADIRTQTEVISIRGEGGAYAVELRTGNDKNDEIIETITAKGIVNAAGPWVETLSEIAAAGTQTQGGKPHASSLRLVKGSHIVVPKMFDDPHAYIFQNADDRVVFAIPYEHDFTLIGTTDVPHEKADDLPEASAKEIAYLCECVNEYFEKDISPEDVVWTYSGVRPLYDDKAAEASEVTRDYVLGLDTPVKGAPFLSVYGGKITTSRKLADHVMEKLEDFYPKMGKPWTRKAHLPGGDIKDADFEAFYQTQRKAYPDIDPTQLLRMARRYGTCLTEVLKNGLGQDFGGTLCEADIRYMVKAEWAKSADDILWRRTRCGLHMSAEQRIAFAEWFEANITFT